MRWKLTRLLKIYLESESTCTNSSQLLTTGFVAQSSNIPVSSQNRKRWLNLARMCERYQLSDKAAAAIAYSVLVDVGKITKDDKTCVIDRSKLIREREKCRQEIQKDEQQNFRFVNAIYFDGRKNATQMVVQGPMTSITDLFNLRSITLLLVNQEVTTLPTFLLKMAKAEL